MRRRCGLFVLWAASVASTPDVLEREALALLDAARNASLGAVATPWPGAGFLSSEVSCFVAYAYARRDCGAAMANVEAALRFQRDDGLVPSYWAPAGAAGWSSSAAAAARIAGAGAAVCWRRPALGGTSTRSCGSCGRG